MSDPSTFRARELVERLWSEPDLLDPLADSVAVPPFAASDPMQHHDELAFLNRHWVWNAAPSPQRGWLRSKIDTLFARALDRYLLDERAFVEHLVRFQNELARRCDDLSEEVRTLAEAQRKLLDAVDERLQTVERRSEALHGALERRLERVEAATPSTSPSGIR